MATTSAWGRSRGATRAGRRRGAQPHIECAPNIGHLPARTVVDLDVWTLQSVDSQSESPQQESPFNFRPNVQGFESISGGFSTFRRESHGSKIPIQFIASQSDAVIGFVLNFKPMYLSRDWVADGSIAQSVSKFGHNKCYAAACAALRLHGSRVRLRYSFSRFCPCSSDSATKKCALTHWSFYQTGVSKNGGSPKSRHQNKARTSQEPKDHPRFLSPFPSLYPMVRRPGGFSYFRALGPKQAAVRTLRVRRRRKRRLAAARRRVSRASKRRHLPSTM